MNIYNAVTNDEREYSRARFGSNDIMNLRSKLSQELHTLGTTLEVIYIYELYIN